MSKHPFTFLAVALALSGCTLMPTYEQPTAPVPATFPDAGETKAGEASEIVWRDFFADERLKKLIELALVNNRDLRVAMLNVEQSQAQYRVTRSSSLPAVDGNGSYTRSHLAGVTSDQWSASLASTAYELDFFGRVKSLNGQALENYLATAEARRSAQISLVAEVATQYFSLRQAQEQLALSRQTLAAVQDSFRLNKATFEAGESNELDLHTAEGQVQNAKINALTYENQQALAEHAITLLIGGSLPADLPAPRAFDENNLLAAIPAGLPSELVQRRPDILQAEHVLKAANANIGAARAAFFPSIKLTGSVGTSSSEFSRLFGAGSGTWSFSPQISVPIFTAGQTRAELDVAKISMRIEVANYEKAIQTAFREVADALFSAGNYASQIEARTALIEAQQKRFDLANARYRQGDDTYLNVLSAQQDLYGAQQGRITAQYNKITSEIALYKALGGGWK